MIEFSTTYFAKKARIRRLPKLLTDYVRAFSKKDAVGVVTEFQKGIANNSFRLQSLKPETKRRKKRRGYRKPATPLYGLGEGRRAYRNMLVIRTRGKSYTVRPSTRKHHESGLRLSDLFQVHEFGTTFKGRGGALIRIPSRPALEKAFARHLRKKRRQEPTAEVRQAINEYINQGKQGTFKKVSLKRITKEFDE